VMAVAMGAVEMSKLDTSAKAVEVLANWNDRSAVALRESNHEAGALSHEETAATLRTLVSERARLRLTLFNLLSVTPAFPAPARQIVGMEDRYNQAIKEAREVLGL